MLIIPFDVTTYWDHFEKKNIINTSNKQELFYLGNRFDILSDKQGRVSR